MSCACTKYRRLPTTILFLFQLSNVKLRGGATNIYSFNIYIYIYILGIHIFIYSHIIILNYFTILFMVLKPGFNVSLSYFYLFIMNQNLKSCITLIFLKYLNLVNLQRPFKLGFEIKILCEMIIFGIRI